MAYSAVTGARLWVQRYNGPGNGSDEAYSVAVSPGGSRVFVTGGSRGTRLGPDYATVAYSAATGARLWVTRYNGPASYDDAARAVAVSPGGRTVYVTGEATPVAPRSRIAPQLARSCGWPAITTCCSPPWRSAPAGAGST